MRQEWKNKRSMYAVVLNTCKKHQTVWSNVPAFAASVNELENKLEEFAQISEERLHDTTNITKIKAKLFGRLHEKVYGVVQIIESYALQEELDNLAMEYDITKTSLKRGGAKAAVNRFSKVVQKATEHATDLEGFGLTAQFLQEITQEVEDARKVILQPRLAIIKRRMLNKRLEQLLDEIDEIVYKHLSGIMRILQFDHPMFFAEFMAARTIIDQKGPRRNTTSNATVNDESPPKEDENDIDDSA